MRALYNTHVKPRLEEVTKWRTEGLFDYQVAQQLGIALSTFYDYKNKHLEFSEALKNGNLGLVCKLKNTLVERAMGFKYTEKKTYTTQDAEGRKIVSTEVIEKFALPDVAALHLALKNFDRENKWTNDPAVYELRKQELEIKKQLAENNINDWRAIE